MRVDQIIEYCWWYLEHLQLILAAGAIFDIICWTVIAIYLNKRRVIGRSRGAANTDAHAANAHADHEWCPALKDRAGQCCW